MLVTMARNKLTEQARKQQALKRGGPLAFAGDGKSLAVGEGQEIHLVEIDTDKVLQTAKLKRAVQGLAASPDGLATARRSPSTASSRW